MHRTQVYITAEQDRRITARAADAKVSKARIIRQLLDQGLDLDDGAAARRRAIEATAGIVEGADDWESWLARVRGAGAAARLDDLRP